MNPESTKALLKKLYLPPQDRFTMVEVPDMPFVMIDGSSQPGGQSHTDAIKWLFAVTYPIKRMAKERMGKAFIEPPLEGLWWSDDPAAGKMCNRDGMNWRMMMAAPEWLDDAMLNDAARTAEEKLDRKSVGRPPESLRVDRFEEGLSVQIMVVGPYPDGATELLKRLHGEFLPRQALIPHGRHHEIYLNDPARTAPSRRKTVVRQPVKPAQD